MKMDYDAEAGTLNYTLREAHGQRDIRAELQDIGVAGAKLQSSRSGRADFFLESRWLPHDIDLSRPKNKGLTRSAPRPAASAFCGQRDTGNTHRRDAFVAGDYWGGN